MASVVSIGQRGTLSLAARQARCARVSLRPRESQPPCRCAFGHIGRVSATLSRVSPVRFTFGCPSAVGRRPERGLWRREGCRAVDRFSCRRHRGGGAAPATRGWFAQLRRLRAAGMEPWPLSGGGPRRPGSHRGSWAPTSLLAGAVIALGWQTPSRELGDVRARISGCSRSALRRATSVAWRGAGCRDERKFTGFGRWVEGSPRSARLFWMSSPKPTESSAEKRFRPWIWRRRSWRVRSLSVRAAFFGGSSRVGALGFRATVQQTAVNGLELAWCGFAGRERVRGLGRLAATVILCSGAEGQGR
jgi:hypothetical protein